MTTGKLSEFRILRLRFECIAIDPLNLPEYKGSMFRGAFGWAAQEISPQLYSLFFASEGGLAERATPNPFVLTPPLDRMTLYPQGHNFVFGLTLIGCGVDAAMHALDACQTMAERGLGGRNGKFFIKAIQQWRPETGWATVMDGSASCWLGPLREVRGDEMGHSSAGNSLLVSFMTPTEVVGKDQPYRMAPPFQALLNRILGRAQMLATELHGLDLLGREDRRELVSLAGDVATESDSTGWASVSRFSAKEQRQRIFGGLTGTVIYRGAFPPFLPWLALGELIHVGKKTSYGFGKIITGANA